jgi:branched-chain amino acid transport system permease protein
LSELYINVLTGGILIGVVYALIAMGLTIIFGVMRIVNFAHGELVVMGMYIGYAIWTHFQLPAIPASIIAAALLFCLGYVLQLTVVNTFINRPQHAQFILYIALALIITGLHLMIMGPDSLSINSPITFESYRFAGLRFDATRVQAAGMAMLMIVGLIVFLRYSHTGRAIRAAADNILGAEAVGIRTRRIYATTAGIGLACAGAAGALVSPLFDAQPYLAPEFTLLAFIIVIIGGLGSLTGAIVGGILIGVAEGYAALWISPSMKSMFSYGLLVLVLLLRPSGLFGDKESV